jgi:uncharacterized membrane protein YhfC
VVVAVVTLEASLLALVGVAGVVVASRLGARWLPFLLAGAAGWLLAQVLKQLLSLPTLNLPGGPAALVAAWWFPFFGAVLPGFAEELGKYVPLRWMRVSGREQALALGLGAGALEALVLALPGFVAPAAVHVTVIGLVIAVWERGWAVTFHAALATLDGAAVHLRRARWLVVAMVGHFLVDLPAGQYQRVVALHAPGAVTWIAVTEVLAPAVALAALALGRRLWAQAGAGGAAGQ